MTKQEYETASDSERKHIDDMTYLWHSNNMLQLLGRDCFEAWKPIVERFTE